MPITIQNELTGDPLETKDINLVAALMALGFRPEGVTECRLITRPNAPGAEYNFVLPELSECGKYKCRELLAAWRQGQQWIEKNPDHPFAYAMATTANHRALIRRIKRGEKQVFLRSGKSIAMLPLDASADLEAKILGNF